MVVVVLAVGAAAFVQVVAGFGFALLAVPLMAVAIDPKVAVVVSTVLGIISTTAQAAQDRRHVEMPLARRLIGASLLGMPAGLVIFLTIDVRVLRIVLGVAVLGAVALIARHIDLSHAGRRLDYALGSLSGVLATSLSTNGPPLVFDLQARRLPPERFRATLSAVLAAVGIVSLVVFVAADQVDGRVVRAVVVGVPAIVVGYVLGRLLRPHVHPLMFHRLVLGLLTLAALSSLTSGVLG
jgi:uncharacterized membrane protein YfcA